MVLKVRTRLISVLFIWNSSKKKGRGGDMGRPKKIKVKIADLLKYLADLPETHPTRQKLTQDKMGI